MGGGRVGVSSVSICRPTTATTGVRSRCPGVLWLLLFVVVPAYAVLAIAFGRVNFLLQPVPAWNPALEPRVHLQRVLRLAAGRRVLAVGPQHDRLRRRRARAVLRDRLPGRVLRRPSREADQDAPDRAAGDPVLGQLPAADAGLDRAARPRTATSTRSSATSGSRNRPDWLNGNPYSVILALVLRVHPVLHPAGVRRPRPDRPQSDRGRPRPRRDAVPGVPARDAAAQPPEHARRLARSSCCRCSATTTPTT